MSFSNQNWLIGCNTGSERAIAPLLAGATAAVHWEARQLCTDLNR